MEVCFDIQKKAQAGEGKVRNTLIDESAQHSRGKRKTEGIAAQTTHTHMDIEPRTEGARSRIRRTSRGVLMRQKIGLLLKRCFRKLWHGQQVFGQSFGRLEAASRRLRGRRRRRGCGSRLLPVLVPGFMLLLLPPFRRERRMGMFFGPLPERSLLLPFRTSGSTLRERPTSTSLPSRTPSGSSGRSL